MKSILKAINKLTNIEIILLLLTIILVIILVINYSNKNIETFESKEKFLIKRDKEIYDDFYVDIYDELVFDEVKNEFEIGKIINDTHLTKHSKILDIGSGTGHHVGALHKLGYNSCGVDYSKSMINKAKSNYPNAKYINDDIMNPMVFNHSSFTHILSLYFTIYYIKDKRQFFENCYDWLYPGGYLILHLVNKNKFDPIMPVGNPFMIVSPQKYSKERITTTVAKFKNYNYSSKFDIQGDNAKLIEKFTNTTNGKVRKNELNLYMSSQNQILSMAKDSGFILTKKYNMNDCGYDYNYLYVLQKPT